MSQPEDPPKLDLDLQTAFLPSWAQKPPTENPYAQYDGKDTAPPRRRGRGDKRRYDTSDRSRRRDKHTPHRDRDRDPNRDKTHRPSRHKTTKQPTPTHHTPPTTTRHHKNKTRNRQQPPHLPNLKITIQPDPKGVESLAKQIRLQGRAYPLFDIATLILQRPDRYHITTTFHTPNKNTTPPQQWHCNIDHTLWLNQEDAIKHILKKHIHQFYIRQKIPTDPPKGNYTYVAQCALSGKILGPPNHHAYQDTLRTHHTKCCPKHINLNTYKQQHIKITHEPEALQKWIQSQSTKTQYQPKNQPDTPPIPADQRDQLIQHFTTHHLTKTLTNAKTHTIPATAALRNPCRPILNTIRRHIEEQRRFPLQIAIELSQLFARHDLHFFKTDRTVTHVSIARPKHLNLNKTPVSPTVKKIIQHIQTHPNCTRRQLLNTLTQTKPTPTPNQTKPQPQPQPPETTNQPTETEPKPTEPTPTQSPTQTKPQPTETTEPTPTPNQTTQPETQTKPQTKPTDSTQTQTTQPTESETQPTQSETTNQPTPTQPQTESQTTEPTTTQTQTTPTETKPQSPPTQTTEPNQTQTTPTKSESETKPTDPTTTEPQPQPKPKPKQPPITPQETAIITDLHWLIHQGHVIEFSNGTLQTAPRAPRKKRPKPTTQKTNQTKPTPEPTPEPPPPQPQPTSTPTKPTTKPPTEPTQPPPTEPTTNQPQPTEPTPPTNQPNQPPQPQTPQTTTEPPQPQTPTPTEPPTPPTNQPNQPPQPQPTPPQPPTPTPKPTPTKPPTEPTPPQPPTPTPEPPPPQPQTKPNPPIPPATPQ